MGVSVDRYVAVVGFGQFYGRKIFKPEQIVKLVKEPNNAFDDEAIRVELEPVGQVGYVANSTATVPGAAIVPVVFTIPLNSSALGLSGLSQRRPLLSSY